MMTEQRRLCIVQYDFNYTTDEGQRICMKEGEEFYLIKKTNKDWWQVTKSVDEKHFYAPADYLKEIPFHEKIVERNESPKPVLPPKKGSITRSSSEEFCDANEGEVEDSASDKLNSSSEWELAECNDDSSQQQTFTTNLIVNNPLYELSNGVVESESDSEECCTVLSALPSNNINVKISNDTLQSTALDGRNFNVVPAPVPRNTKINVKACDNSLQKRSPSPVYANIHVSCCPPNPPSPEEDDIPIEKLNFNWAEYEAKCGRKYFYNNETGESSWKPPRRKTSTESKDDYQYSRESSFSADDNSLSSKHLSPVSPPSCPVPPGWILSHDESTGEYIYVNLANKQKWFLSVDEQGRIYYFDESGLSTWQLPELPDVIITKADDESYEGLSGNTTPGSISDQSPAGSPVSSPRGIHQKLLGSSPLRTRSYRVHPISAAERGTKSRSMVIAADSRLSLDDPDGINKASTLPRSISGPCAPGAILKVVRQGLMNKTKLNDTGKKIRKSWSSSFIILTDSQLMFFKDMKAAKQKNGAPSNKPEICFELGGAVVEWTPDKSSRKNVFGVQASTGFQVLLQDDNIETSEGWFEAIKGVISKCPHIPNTLDVNNHNNNSAGDVTSPGLQKKATKLSRTKSKRSETKSTGSTEDLEGTSGERKLKIKAKLLNFFLRRPTMESLEKKGIIKDETVFGCHLHNLCAREKSNVPKFVQKCTAVIEEKDMKADGLYRASGNLSQVQKIRFQVNQDKLDLLDSEEDVHVLTGALKMFFRELKEPLFPYNTFQKFLRASTLPDRKSKMQTFTDLIRGLPKVNYETLKFLLRHLIRVTDYSEENRMHIQNLAIVFGPALMWPETESANMALDMMHQNQVIEFLLLEYNAMFM